MVKTLYPVDFTYGKQSRTHWIGEWVGPGAGPDVCGEEKSLLLLRDSNTGLWGTLLDYLQTDLVLAYNRPSWNVCNVNNTGLLGSWKMVPIYCPETSVSNYKSKLHKIPEKLRSHLHPGGSLKSRKILYNLCINNNWIYIYIYTHTYTYIRGLEL